MPKIVSDIVDTYVIRRLNARVQFMLLQRASDVPMPSTWQGFHAQIDRNEPTLAASVRAVKAYSGLNVSAAFAADYVNQFYDETRDVLVLAPVIAVEVHPQAPVSLGEDYRDIAWLDEKEATARLPFAGQRAAVRRIAEVIGIGEAEANMYRLDVSPWIPTTTPSPAHAEHASVVTAPDDESDDIR